jgi:pyruvate,water dikinase
VLHELGRRLVVAGVVGRPDDVFWLRRAELLASPAVPRADVVARRRAVWRGQRQVTPPQVLPAGSWRDRAVRRRLPATAAEQTGDTIRGVGASAGQVTATARVIGGPADFGRLQPGDGPLSHSSIVAREYGIPAVLGTNVASRRIPDGARVRVDGDAGTVTVLDGA